MTPGVFQYDLKTKCKPGVENKKDVSTFRATNMFHRFFKLLKVSSLF